MKPALQFFNYTFTNKSDDEVDIHIDGYIVDSPTQEMMREWWGDETSVSYKSFRNQIEKANPKILNVYVNSGGGHVGDAMAMHDYLIDLERKGIKVNRIGRGIVASAATYLVMGKNSEVSENTFFMIHNVQMVCWGDIVQCENQVKAGRKFNDTIRDFYAKETGQPPETIAGWMNKETWMNGQEAKERGFVKNVTGSAEFSNSIKPEQWPYSNMAVLNTYNSFTKNHDEMKIDMTKIGDSITAAVNGAFEKVLNKLGIKKEENKEAETAGTEFANAVTTAITDALKPIAESLAGVENITETITNAVNTAITNLKLSDTITNQVAEAVKNLATKEEVTKLSNDVAKKLGKPAAEREETKAGDRTVRNKRDFFRAGTFASEEN